MKTYAIAAGKDYRVGWFDGTGIAIWEQLKEEKVVVDDIFAPVPMRQAITG